MQQRWFGGGARKGARRAAVPLLAGGRRAPQGVGRMKKKKGGLGGSQGRAALVLAPVGPPGLGWGWEKQVRGRGNAKKQPTW